MTAKGKRAIGLLLITVGVALCSVGIWVLVSPAQYQAIAQIRTWNLQSEIDAYIKAHPELPIYDIFLFPKEGQIFNEVILSNVVVRLHLAEEWNYSGKRGVEQATRKLRRGLKLENSRSSPESSIKVTLNNPVLAANIANAIAEAYRNYRQEEMRRRTLEGIARLEAEYEKWVQQARTAESNRIFWKQELKIPDPEPLDLGTNYQPYLDAKEQVEKLLRRGRILTQKLGNDLDNPLPKPIVILVKVARPPESPVGPNRQIGAALLAIGLALIAVGLRLGVCGPKAARTE